MPNDVKLGLVLGLGLVVLISVVYFRKEPPVGPAVEPAVSAANPAATGKMNPPLPAPHFDNPPPPQPSSGPILLPPPPAAGDGLPPPSVE
jgi:hypothetical protein